MNASDFKEALKDEITEENIPVSLGGKFALYNEPYEFDLSPSGPFFTDLPPLPSPPPHSPWTRSPSSTDSPNPSSMQDMNR